MRLLSVEVRGIRRLLDCKCHLGGKVTAVVGPNEAGKSTLLFALRHLSTDAAIPASNLSRVSHPDNNQVVVAADWEVDDDDRAALSEFELAKPPARLRIEKKPTGSRTVVVSPEPERRPNSFSGTVVPLRRFIESNAGRGLPRQDVEEEGDPEIGDDLDWILSSLESGGWRSWTAEDLVRVASAKDILKDTNPSSASLASRAAANLGAVIVSARYRDPQDSVWKVLLDRVPPCVEFEQDDRELASDYDLNAMDLEAPPQALVNLVNLAGLDLAALMGHVQAGDTGMAATLLRRANEQLAAFYIKTWSQSELCVALDRDGLRLDILIEEAEGSTYVLNERSDGLRAFVALTAFLASQEVERPILLIDEAETHLHYDAQRDLVDVLIEQNVARQVIYTTHSPGCLPPDLGTSIRAVVPVDDRPGTSKIVNDFWSANAPGFSPLLLMMGAAAAAFTTTRAALLVEGPSDMILLPSLIRQAVGLPALPYHVAPGLSATAPEHYAEFDLVAARLVYVVDGDPGGEAIRSRLLNYGVPDGRILALGGRASGMTLEDLVRKSSFLMAVNRELSVAGAPELAGLPDGHGRYNLMKEACGAAGTKPPSKVALAGRLLWQEGGLELEGTGRRALLQLHRTASQLLEDGLRTRHQL